MIHKFKKKWSQNFLIDENISRKIVNLLNIKEHEAILEIGPGKGSLSKYLINKTKNLSLVEIDPILANELNNNLIYKDVIKIHNQDILKFNIDLFNNYKIVGNVPYNITTPIIFKFLNNRCWSLMLLMIQKEVANRIVAKPNSKTYGRLSVMCQAFSDVKVEFHVNKNVFFPKPKIDSSVISFKPKESNIKNITKFKNIVKYSFSQRRKKIKNNLNDVIPIEHFKEFADKRAEQLTVEDFIKISSK